MTEFTFDGSLAGLGALALRGGLLLLLAHVTLFAMRNHTAAARERAGRWFCVALCLAPLLNFTRIAEPTPPRDASLHPRASATSQANPPRCKTSEPSFAILFEPAPQISAAPPVVKTCAAWMLGMWITVTLCLLARSLIGHAIAARRLPGPGAQILPESLRRQVGVRVSNRIFVSPAATQPLVVGWLRPAIVLPTAFLQWPVARQRAALTHERAHIHRHDGIGRWLSHLTRAIWWPLPGLRRFGDVLATAQEQACDDQALRAGIEPVDYAEALVQMARDLRSAPALPTTVLAMTSPSQLETRVQAVLLPTTRREPIVGWPWMLPAVAGFAAVLLLPQAPHATASIETPTGCDSTGPSILTTPTK